MKISTGANAKSLSNNHSLTCRATEADTRKVIGERILTARELNGYQQTEAARLFGYRTPAQLSQWEMARRTPPLKMLIRACGIYRVSMDYLTGISEDPDRDPVGAEKMLILKGAETALAEMAQKLADALIYQTNLHGPTVQMAIMFLSEGEKFMAAYRKFVTINRETFDELRGGNTLAVAADGLEGAILKARETLDRHRRIKDAALKGVIKTARPIENHPLFD